MRDAPCHFTGEIKLVAHPVGSLANPQESHYTGEILVIKWMAEQGETTKDFPLLPRLCKESPQQADSYSPLKNVITKGTLL
jgi:hypothetical protein